MTAIELREAVDEMRRQCRLSEPVCRAALKQSRGDVEAAMRRLVDARKLPLGKLNLEAAPAELVGRARTLEAAWWYRRNTIYLPATREKLARREEKRLTNPGALRALGRKLRKEARAGAQAAKRDKAESRKRSAKKRQALERNRTPRVLEAAPFPRMKVDRYEWKGQDVLPTWADSFRSRRRGKVEVEVRVPTEWTAPRPAQAAAYRYLKQNEAKVTDAILRFLFGKYPALRKHYRAEVDEGSRRGSFWMPKVSTPGEIKRLVTPSVLMVLADAKAGVAYIGVVLTGSFVDEHGLGIVLHKDRVVDFGDADTATESTAIKKDGGRPVA